MINLSIAMLTNSMRLLMLAFALLIGRSQVLLTPQIDHPRSGEALQGVVIISGSTDISGFSSAEISFSYASDNAVDTRSWFLIQTANEPVSNAAIAIWDTTTIADGLYDLRVEVILANGNRVNTIVKNLRVRNYTPVETSVPQSGSVDPTREVPSPTPAGSGQASPQPVQQNTLELTPDHFMRNLYLGVLAGAGSLALLGIYIYLRSKLHR